ncbi:flagellin [Dermatophilus congolensis]|uniref:Flagellin n=1 Tax=Dermatophilus congolensis TaxID=1863 RepID=A0A239VVT4_9MICO|nr:flagellin [Dermatophilus congolensis]MBO3130019.1 flagellin FliC [Dermatophilus congolensis]MBO3131351.1 flagellin FliC [Dermatophilus congolensis]MBO3134493.1 flagellin FliC [Dermatophilus congolensis]MBO3136728.1 flagellin FliC [Dermatophilus congolensis]MBO3138973.1 flagellin FliC [Dermatophilus congolensis]
MGLQINTNVAALNAYRNLSGTQGSQQTSLERLSSGLRINRAADDAAGLAISEKLRSQVNGLNQAQANAQDGVSLVQTAEGAMNETHAMLQRMRTLAVQAGNDTNTSSDRAAIQKEIGALLKEIDSTTTRTQFNGMNLLDGTFTGKALQIGANTGQTMSITIKKMDTAGLSINGLTVTSAAGLKSALGKIDKAIGKVSDQRADLGALQNRLDHTIKNLGVSSENLAASESRIRDTDMAKEMTSFTRSQILQQAGTAMLSQANQSSQGVLRLLG